MKKLKFIIILLMAAAPLYAGSGSSFMDNEPKFLTGDNLGAPNDDLGDWAARGSSMTFGGYEVEIGTSTAGRWVVQRKLMPFKTIYYQYTSEYDSAMVWEGLRGKRAIEIPFEFTPPPPLSTTTWYRYRENIYVRIDTTTHWTTAAMVIDNWAGRPPPPVNLTITPGNEKITLDWEHPKVGGVKIRDIVGYLIERSTDNTRWTQLKSTQIVTVSTAALITDTLFVDFGLKNKTTYFYRLRTIDAYYRYYIAGQAEYYSNYSEVVAAIPNRFINVAFNLDLTGYGKVEDVYIKGNFTDWDNGKIRMSSIGEGIWSVRKKLVDGSWIEYKYEVNGSDEPDLSPIQPNRKVQIMGDINTEMEINDRWGIPKYKSPVPPGIGWIVSSSTDTGAKIEWVVDRKADNITHFILYRSSFAYAPVEIASGTIDNFTYFIDSSITPSVTYYYFITSVSSVTSPAESYITDSTPVEFNYYAGGSIVPSFTFSDRVQPVKNVVALPSSRTGEIKFNFNAPKKLSNEAAHRYFILYSTFPIDKNASIIEYNLVGIKDAHYPGTLESFTASKRGSRFPGFFFYILAVYGNYNTATISEYKYAVAGKEFASNKDWTMIKGSNRWGKLKEGEVINLNIARLSIPSPDGIVVIHNLKELVTIQNEKLLVQISEANNRATHARKHRVLKDNEFDKNQPASVSPTSSIFKINAWTKMGKNIFTEGGQSPHRRSANFITISIPFKDDNNDGYLDSSESCLDPVPVESLRIYRLNEQGNFWSLVRDGGKNKVDTTKKVVQAEVTHFSVFAVLARGNAATDLSNVKVFPNPYQPYDGRAETGRKYSAVDPFSGITFVNLTENARIWVYNIAGELVADNLNTAFSTIPGEFRWDATNSRGEELASGLYVFLVRDETIINGQNKFTGRLTIIR